MQPPSPDEARLLGNRTLISFLHQSVDKDAIAILASQKSTAMSMNMLPSQYRGLSYDAITSQVRIPINFTITYELLIPGESLWISGICRVVK